MKVNSNRDISFKSIYTNRTLKKSLEFAADNGALFSATSTVAFSLLRPISIWMTPNTDRENRELAVSKSIASSLIGFGITLALSLPLAAAIKHIDKNPEKYLKADTIKFLKDKNKELKDSKAYTLGTQIFKLGLGSVVAIPKAVMVGMSIPYLMQTFSKDKYDTIGMNDIQRNYGKTSFKSKPTEKLAGFIGKILDKKPYQKFSEKHKDSNFPMHITALTDTVATGAFIHQAKRNDKIPTDRKNTLIYNSAFATILSVISGYGVDKLLEKPTTKFIEKFENTNKGQKNLQKQVLGIKIVKPILILGTIYYGIIPFISTFLAEKTSKGTDS